MQKINDGHDLKGTVESRGSEKRLVFQYRPALGPAVYEFLDKKDLAGSKNKGKIVAEFLAEYVHGWDRTDPNKPDATDTIPVSVETLAGCSHWQLEGMLSYVENYAKGEEMDDAKNS